MATKEYNVKRIFKREEEKGIVHVEASMKRGFFQSLFGSAPREEEFILVEGEAMNQYAKKAFDDGTVWNVDFSHFSTDNSKNKLIHTDKRVKRNPIKQNPIKTSPTAQAKVENGKDGQNPTISNTNANKEFISKIANSKREIIQAAEEVISNNCNVQFGTSAVLSSRLEDFLALAPSIVPFQNTKVELYNLHSLYLSCSSNELSWNVTIDVEGFAYSIFDLDYIGESHYRTGSSGITPTVKYSDDNICKFYSDLTRQTIRPPRTTSFKPQKEMVNETLAQYEKIKELCKVINIDFNTSTSIKEVMIQNVMKSQVLWKLGELVYSDPKGIEMARLCNEVGIIYNNEPSEEYFKQYWERIAVLDIIDKELIALKELLDKQK